MHYAPPHNSGKVPPMWGHWGKGHSVAECQRPRRDVPPKGGTRGCPRPKGTPQPPRGGRGGRRGGGRAGRLSANNADWLEGADPNQGWEYDADYYEAGQEDDYEEGTTIPSPVIEDVTDQPSAGAAYVMPSYSPEPTAMLSDRSPLPLTPILDTGASHCLLPASYLTKEEAELATRVHLRVANGSTTRALMYQNIIYARKVPRPLISIGQVTHTLGLTFTWSGDVPHLSLQADGSQHEVLTATLWNSLPCVTDSEMK
eukprot:6474671-Amphidinium_carterae.1